MKDFCNDLNLYTSFINQIFDLLHRSRIPSMNICTTDVSLGWRYDLFGFGNSINANAVATNHIGNMIFINPANIKNIILSSGELPDYFDIKTTILVAVTHELSHTEQDIDLLKYGQ